MKYLTTKPEYLFIRILEACNANCFMCDFRQSKDQYRFSPKDMEEILPRVKEEGIKYIRLTGGEPLLHKDILDFLRLIKKQGMKSSIITNGFFLEKKINALVEAGLNQIIVSIDGTYPETHDRIRNTPDLFNRAIRGLRKAVITGIVCRVNTVCGFHNFREMPQLQDLLTEIGVHQWELSSLKLERPLEHSAEDRLDIEGVINYVYRDAFQGKRLIPMGKIWCGETEEERERYFTFGITPRADHKCLLVDKVRYLDAKNGYLYACSLISHRPKALEYAAPVLPSCNFSVMDDRILRQVDYFKKCGPSTCTGCSTTASGYSNQLLFQGNIQDDWSF